MTTTETRLLTADDLLRLYSEGVRGELIRGVLCETMPTGREHGAIVVNLSTELRNFIKPRRLGWLVASDSGVWLERDPDTVREPDIAFTSAERSPLEVRITGYAEVTPDLVAEIVSPSGQPSRGPRQSADVVASTGVRLVWVVYPGHAYSRRVSGRRCRRHARRGRLAGRSRCAAGLCLQGERHLRRVALSPTG